MSGVTNTTSRQYNLKCIGRSGNRVTVRVAPGFNVIDDEHWQEFVSKDGKTIDPYVDSLKKEGKIVFGKIEDDKELEQDPDTKSKSKSAPMPKSKPNKD